jgi:alpha-galactosidase
MGWNPWYQFECNVNEQLIKQSADAMVTSGMAAAGYRYVNLDDCWMAKTRDANGELQADPARFPDGIQGLADYVHARGLLLGIYLDAGSSTCAGYPGSAGHYREDAVTLGRWGVDYVKMDWCHTGTNANAAAIYTQVRDALAAAGRPMVLSICNWGIQSPWSWGPATGNLWRTDGDFNWYGAPKNYWSAILAVAGHTSRVTRYAGPGAWNDPDLLVAGNKVLTPGEERAQFSLWSMMSAPLLAGNDLRTMSKSTLALLSNRDVIAVDQDPSAYPVVRVGVDGTWQSWIRPLTGSSRALLLLNTGAHTASKNVSIRSVGLPAAPLYRVEDLWTHRLTHTRDKLTVRVAPRDVALLRIYPTQPRTAKRH